MIKSNYYIMCISKGDAGNPCSRRREGPLSTQRAALRKARREQVTPTIYPNQQTMAAHSGDRRDGAQQENESRVYQGLSLMGGKDG
jgi:hypothetical protein